MVYLHLTAIFALGLLAWCRRRLDGEQKTAAGSIPVLLFGAAFLIRLLCACFSSGFSTDMSCFAAWAERMWAVGPKNFYSPDVFSDYPPGFLYYLFLVGGVCKRFGIAYGSRMQIILIKLPAVMADMACGGLIYRETKQRRGSGAACVLAAVYLFQPVVILDSALWGQVDSLIALLLVIMCLKLVKGELPAAYLAFVLGVLVKPQMLVFAPALLAGILDQVFLKDFSWKKLGFHLLCGLEAIACAVVLCLPFGLGNVLKQYAATLGEYPYAAVNAYNFWGFWGKNWVSQSEKFLFMSYQGWGAAVIPVIVFLALSFSLRKKGDPAKYPLIAAFCVITMFLFSVRMHERYLYPGLVMLLLAYLYSAEDGLYLCFGVFSVLSFYNMANVLFFYDPSNYNRKAPIILAVSAGMLLCGGYLYYLISCLWRGRKAFVIRSARADRREFDFGAAISAEAFRVTAKDIIVMAVITALYSGFALTGLGDKTAPARAYDIKQGEQIELTFSEPVTSFSYYIAPKQERSFLMSLRGEEDETWQQTIEIELDDVFKWQEIKLEEPAVQIRLVAEKQASVFELCFKNNGGTVIAPLNAAQYERLFDEQELCPERSSFRNSMYFDEIYHARTAYEFLHGMYSYENTHPPLGKILIALGVLICGMTPFGWRITGTIFGVLMVPAAYLFGKRITGSTTAASLAGMLFAFDFMHFTQTRIATIDVYITFFVILMYYCMYRYVEKRFRNGPQQTGRIWLALCGISMGLGVACKWTGAYAGLGLAVLFFGCLFLQYPHMQKKEFWLQTGKTLAVCIVFFVCIPAAIYLLSYLPFQDGTHDGLLQKMLFNQGTMFRYHSGLESTHAFSSLWYQWPVMTRPIWYYSGIAGETLREGISAFGNPLVWWVGIPAFGYMLWRIMRYRDGRALFLVVGYMAQYLPWMFIERLTFIYHYFPCVIFVVLMIVYSMQRVVEWLSPVSAGRRRYLLPACAAVYALAAFGLFLLFYPVLSGAPVEAGFVDRWLRWMDSWVLVAG